MKYVHTDGTEYEVADLIYAVDQVATHKLDIPMVTRYKLSAAAALIARHERVCEATERLLVALDVRDPLLIEIDADAVRTALRGEEAPRA